MTIPIVGAAAALNLQCWLLSIEFWRYLCIIGGDLKRFSVVECVFSAFFSVFWSLKPAPCGLGTGQVPGRVPGVHAPGPGRAQRLGRGRGPRGRPRGGAVLGGDQRFGVVSTAAAKTHE